jgi:protein-disulfide isomerase
MVEQKALVERLADSGVKSKDLYWRTVSAQYEQIAPSGIDETPEDLEPQGPVIAHIPIDDAPVKGAAPDDALVTIVTFSDFQCPFCSAAIAIVDSVVSEDTRLAFRHFPLGNHPQAGAAALASIVAQESGKFWEYHDLLFANQTDLSNDALNAHARKLGLDPEMIEAAMNDTDRQTRVIDDQRLGVAMGVQGTPTFFINGVMMMGIESAEAFQGLVNSQRELGKIVKEETGLSGEELYQAIVERNRKLLQGGNDS